MKLKFFFVLALTVIIFVGCSPENRGEEVTILEIPATYQGWTNPQSGSEAISAGKLIYEVNCVACHGDTGLGDGPAGGSLVPAPVNFYELYPLVGEDYYYFVILEGVPGTSMVPWKNTLTEEEIYQVIAYVREFK
jgi:mono/diheme cytochrome c family protein